MIAFAYPWWLATAAVALAAAVFAWRTAAGRRAALRYPAAAGFSLSSPTLAARLSRPAPVALSLAALVLVSIALARPQRLTRREAAASGRGIDIMLVLDTSLSMAALDFEPNRLGAAKDTALRFVRGRAEDRIGLVVFGGAPMLACPLTLDYEALSQRIQEMQPGMTQVQGTAVGDGLVSGLNHLKAGDAKSKIMILLTDGRSNTGAIDALTGAKAAAALGVKVYAIGTAKRGTAMMPVDDPVAGRVLQPIEDDLDEDLLQQIAQLTDGKFFRATNLSELREVYATIDALEKSAIKLPDPLARRDLHRAPLLAAALLILCQASLVNTRLLRWP